MLINLSGVPSTLVSNKLSEDFLNDAFTNTKKEVAKILTTSLKAYLCIFFSK